MVRAVKINFFDWKVKANIPWKMKRELIGDIIPMGKLLGIDPGGF